LITAFDLSSIFDEETIILSIETFNEVFYSYCNYCELELVRILSESLCFIGEDI
jgi:hypothetical protein